MKRLYTFMLSALVAAAASAAIPVSKAPAGLAHSVATEVVSPLIGGLHFRAAEPQQTLAASVKHEARLQNKQTKSRALETRVEGGQLKRVAKAPRKADGTGSKFDGTYTLTAGEWYFESQAQASVPVQVEMTVKDGVAVISNDEYLVSDIMALLNEETGVMSFVNYYVGNTQTSAVSFMPFIYNKGISFTEYSITYNEATESFDIPVDHGFSWPAWDIENIEDAKVCNVETFTNSYFDVFDIEGLAKNGTSGEEPETPETWNSIGNGEWYEGLLNVYYSDVQDGWHWPVEILESSKTSGMYKIYPYAVDSPLSELLGGTKDAKCEVIVNATNPKQVYITNTFSPYGLKTFASVTQFGVNTFGTLSEKVISFPDKAFASINGSQASFVNGGSDFKIALPGAVVKDYTLKATTDAICPTSATTTVKLQAGADIATIYATILGGKYDTSFDNNAQIVTTIGSQLEPGNISFDTPTESGLYSIMIAGVNAEGEVVAATTTYQVVDAENDADWAVVPNTKATYTEGFLAGMFSDVNPEDFEVVLEENVNTPGRFRFESPYANHSMGFPMLNHTAAHKHYIYVNATNPEKVYVEFSPTGVNMNGFGSVYGFSVPALYAGTENFSSVEASEFGKYTDGKITAPARTSFNNEPYALTNYNSEFTLTIEKTAPVETWKSIGEGEWHEGLLHGAIPFLYPEGMNWKVDIEESETTPGLYRIKPYASDNYLSENFRDGEYDEETVIYINATDPTKVYTTAESNFFPYEMCKFIGNNPENGQDGAVYGTLENGVITFPEGAFYLDDEYAGKMLLEAGSSFMILLPGATPPAPVETWKSVGEGVWYEGLLAAANPWGFPTGLSWKIDVEESENTPGLYRIKPYASDNYLSENFRDGEYDEETVIYINATDPNKVYTTAESNFFPYEMSKFIGNNPENGQDGAVYGTLKDYIITFPGSSFYLDDEYAGKVLLENGTFKVALPGATTEVERIELGAIVGEVGEYIKIRPEVLVTDNTLPAPAITWSSTNPEVAAVDEDGKVWFNAAGSATVIAECGGVEYTMPFEVEAVLARALNVFPVEAVGGKGHTFCLLALHEPDNTTDKSVTWESEDPSVASVDETGRVELLSAGSTKIHATSGEHTASCSITVDDTINLTEIASTGVAIDIVEGGITVRHAEEGASIAVYTIDGKVINGAVAGTTDVHIALAAGIYIVKVSPDTVAKVLIP